MRTQKKGRIAFAVCGSFCTLEAALAAAQQLTEQGWELLPSGFLIVEALAPGSSGRNGWKPLPAM